MKQMKTKLENQGSSCRAGSAFPATLSKSCWSVNVVELCNEAGPAQSSRPQPEFPLSFQCCSAKMRACFQTKLCCLLDQGEPHQWKTLWARWIKFLVLATLRVSYEEVIPVSCFYTFPCWGVQGVLSSPSHPVTALILLSWTPVDMSSFRIPWPWEPSLWLHSHPDESRLLLFRFLCQALLSTNSKYLQVVVTAGMGVLSSCIFVLPHAKPLLGMTMVWSTKYLYLECFLLWGVGKMLSTSRSHQDQTGISSTCFHFQAFLISLGAKQLVDLVLAEC